MKMDNSIAQLFSHCKSTNPLPLVMLAWTHTQMLERPFEKEGRMLRKRPPGHPEVHGKYFYAFVMGEVFMHKIQKLRKEY